MHVDPVHARRLLFGEPVVHGVHLLLWALDAWSKEHGAPWLDRITATFRKPLIVGHDVEFELGDTLVARSREQVVLELAFHTSTPRNEWELQDQRFEQAAPPLELGWQDLEHASGETPLIRNGAIAGSLFPSLVNQRSHVQLCELLAATRIVGMQCPGLHSIFSRLDLRATQLPTDRVTYRVQRAVEKYSSVQLLVTGPTLAGTLDTFVRPRPAVISLAAGRVPADRFTERRALVIGGSRGLGEAFARVLAAGGAQVHVTYRHGGDEAVRLAREVGATSSHYDVLAGTLELPWSPTHVYYFATPKIRIARDEPFSPEDLKTLIEYYVLGLERVVRTVGPCRIYAPSTSFLDGSERGTAAYTIAKAAMEELGRRLPELYPVTVSMPRLPRVATDQTASLIAIPCADPVEVAISQLVDDAAESRP